MNDVQSKIKTDEAEFTLQNSAWHFNSRRINDVLRVIVLTLVSIITVYPLFWMITNSFKEAEAIIREPLNPAIDSFDFENFRAALEMAPFDRYIFNSAFTAFFIVGGQLLLSALMAYGFAFYEFPGKKALFTAVMLTYMLPAAATYVPSYIILARADLLDTLTGIIVSNLASVFTLFLLVQTFEAVPREMIEAAQMDGASDRTILFKVVLPYTKSTVLTAGLIAFVGMYNNYMWPSLITTSKEKMLISVGLNTFFTSQGNFRDNLPKLMAANTMAVLPLLLLFIVMQKHFIKGISDSGVKG